MLYFPKIIEGPISRFKELSICFYEENKFAFRNIFIGLDLIIYGLFKKMVIVQKEYTKEAIYLIKNKKQYCPKVKQSTATFVEESLV